LAREYCTTAVDFDGIRPLARIRANQVLVYHGFYMPAGLGTLA